EEIRIMSWNIMSDAAVDALIAAQHRGVRVLVIMDATNVSAEVPNPGFKRLRASLASFNTRYNLKPERRSYAKVCDGACRRGSTASAHAKYYLFSAVGKTKWVVIQGSANLTSASANNQWNDVFTYVDRQGIYDFARRIHIQMWQDKNVWPAWEQYRTPTYDLYFSPRIADVTKNEKYSPSDPLLSTLNQVRCKGAVSGNANHRTVIRAAPDVIRGGWADNVARRLKALWDAGCDVKIGYTIIGINTRKILTARSGRGPVPLRQLVSDVNGDKVFDLYFHLKAWTVNGWIGDNKAAYWTMNGSSNISALSQASDENIGVFRQSGVTLTYQRHIDYWFNNPPRSRPVVPSLVPDDLDPYANMERDY
ncbi:MAG TPA: phospholipase D-like domain-containing protein, partial [Nocardioides sp.]|nr:phospholipase D-like domain-containing protein [Nocardioides sp.]